ncbi:hypothetical protein SAMN05518672_1011293 [Chitinophaga sp. CF118]|uniref:DUF4157 domain-containing protein n=1 Tax=Chitinophaga sp. CF118 TaxID=1884367 RepID=UPI0008DFB621|nr:DUF4157 domain-containing protein [Chitinophaga sp. CF118]SFD25467.1 hypothetical protein SAMN05518672_1011293 [Chitinophaga sp. CF118]
MYNIKTLTAVKCHIKERSVLARIAARRMKSERIAMVIGKTIYLHGVNREEFLQDISWVRHEVCHVVQYRELGLIPFLWHYLWECKRVGYYQNRFEIAARAAERDPAILRTVSII